MNIIAKGILKHHFWGDYRATIALEFHNGQLAALALPKLPGFSLLKSHPEVLTYHGGGAELKLVEALLVKLGADRKKLSSLAKSIDYGEPFTIAVDLTPEGPKVEQLSLLVD